MEPLRFNIESGVAKDAVQRIVASRWLKLTGLHSHIGTFVLDVRAYAAQIRIMTSFMEEVERDTGCIIEYLDGGFASRNARQGLYLPPGHVAPSFEQYAEAICGALMEVTRERSAAGKPLPVLVLETGRAIVDDAETLVTTVVGGKRLPDGRRAAILDAGVNILFTALWYDHEVKPLRPLDGIAEDTVLYGPLCMNMDVVRASIMLPPLNVGESLAIRPVGAYNNTHLRPAVVMVTPSGRVEVLRAAEQLKDVSGLEEVPDALHQSFPQGLPE